jgi:hypothetical protein
MPSITWSESVDVAQCDGWIDGQAKSLDDRHSSLSPLRSSSLATASVVRRQRERSASGGATEANSGEVAESSVGVTWGARCAGGGTTPCHAVSEAPRPARVLACSRSADRPSTQLQRRRSLAKPWHNPGGPRRTEAPSYRSTAWPSASSVAILSASANVGWAWIV